MTHNMLKEVMEAFDDEFKEIEALDPFNLRANCQPLQPINDTSERVLLAVQPRHEHPMRHSIYSELSLPKPIAKKKSSITHVLSMIFTRNERIKNRDNLRSPNTMVFMKNAMSLNFDLKKSVHLSEQPSNETITVSDSLKSILELSKQESNSQQANVKTARTSHIETRVNQYCLLDMIGSGSFGKVVLAKDESDERFYACKIISKSRLRKGFRFSGEKSFKSDNDVLADIRLEIAILKKLSHHPRIVSLREVLDDSAHDNLYLIHHKKIIHRDIKPENLLLNNKNELLIGDFGLSHMFEDARTNIPWKNSTPLFTAPECEMGELSVSIGKANDIWSLGVTLYCFVHGRCPFEDINPVELNRKIKQEEPYYSSNLSATLRDLLKMMLKKSPNDRITVKRIKKHAWVTQNGKSPMISSDKNCISEEVTEEDVKNAFRPAGELVSKLVNHLKNFRKKSKSSNPQARSLSTKRCTSTSLIHG